MDSLSTKTLAHGSARPRVPASVCAAITDGTVSEDAVHLVEAVGVFGVAYRRMLDLEAAKDGVSVSRLRLLHLLQIGGAQIMSDLRRQLGVTARNVTQLVDGLEDDGLARRVAHPTDRRATFIEITSTGQSLMHEGWSAHVISMAALFDRLEAKDRPVLLRLMNELRGHMQDMGIDAACGPDT